MIDLKTIIQKEVGRRQRGYRIRPGDFFLRGGKPIEVTGRDGGAVHFVSMISGKSFKMKHSEFISLALDRVKYTGKQSDDFLRTVWGYASAKSIPFRDRVRIVREYLKGAKSDTDAEILRSWIFALSNEMEPRK